MPISKTAAQSESDSKSFPERFFSRVKAYQIWILLILGLIVGLVFVFAVPPWMHYDEPGHFEYAWLIANRPGLPSEGDYDQDLRRQISTSIIEVDIEAYTGMVTDPLQIDEPISIWVTHIGNHPPTYYLLASLPLWLFKHSDIVFQLYLVRLLSLWMFLAFIWISYRACRTIFGDEHPLTWMVPLFLVTLPALVDVMTAANNDVLAILAFSLFFWASLEVYKKGLSLTRVALLVGSMLLCLLAKNTAWLAVPQGLLVILTAFLKHQQYQKWVWIALLGLIVLGGVMVISWRESTPAHFYSLDLSTRPKQVITDYWELGEAAIAQDSQKNSRFKFFHLLASQDARALSTETVTFGAWIWADQPTSIEPPGIQQGLTIEPLLASAPVKTRSRLPIPGITDVSLASPIDIKFTTSPIELTTIPQFHVFKTIVPPMGDNITWVYFNPSTDPGNRVYWDGIVLLIGDYTEAGLPFFDSEDAGSGTWGSETFTNLIRNASGEDAWPVFARWVSKILPERTYLPTSDILSIFDFRATSLYFKFTAERLFRTFWAVFGWANVPMYGQKPYRFFLLLSLLAMIGILLSMIRKMFDHTFMRFLVLAGVVVLQMIMVVIRGVGSWFTQTYFPVARYFYPVIIPMGILIATGLHEIAHDLHAVTGKSERIFFGAYICLQLGIILWGIVSIFVFYRL